MTGEVIDRIVALWRQAEALGDEADLLITEATSKNQEAARLYDEAEDLWKPIADVHPEWREAFIEERDPRDPE